MLEVFFSIYDLRALNKVCNQGRIPGLMGSIKIWLGFEPEHVFTPTSIWADILVQVRLDSCFVFSFTERETRKESPPPFTIIHLLLWEIIEEWENETFIYIINFNTYASVSDQVQILRLCRSQSLFVFLFSLTLRPSLEDLASPTKDWTQTLSSKRAES